MRDPYRSLPDTLPAIGPFRLGTRLRVRGVYAGIAAQRGFQDREEHVITLKDVVSVHCSTHFGDALFRFGRVFTRVCPLRAGQVLELDARVAVHPDYSPRGRAVDRADHIYRLTRPTKITLVDDPSAGDRPINPATEAAAERLNRRRDTMTTKIEMRATVSLRQHPRNEWIYRDADTVDEDFVANIEEHGIMQPLTVLRNGVLVGGGRRLAAAIRLNMSEVPVVVLDAEGDLDELDVLEKLLTLNSNRAKTNEQRAREMIVREEIEAERAKRRKAAGQRAGGRARHAHDASGEGGQLGGDIATKLPDAERRKTRTKVAEQGGMGEKRAEESCRVVKAIDRLAGSGRMADAERLRQTLNKNVHKAFVQAQESGHIKRKQGKRSNKKVADTATPATPANAVLVERAASANAIGSYRYVPIPRPSNTDSPAARAAADAVLRIVRDAVEAGDDTTVFAVHTPNKSLGFVFTAITACDLVYATSAAVVRGDTDGVLPDDHHSVLVFATRSNWAGAVEMDTSVIDSLEGPDEEQTAVINFIERLAGAGQVPVLGSSLRTGRTTARDSDSPAEPHVDAVVPMTAAMRPSRVVEGLASDVDMQSGSPPSGTTLTA